MKLQSKVMERKLSSDPKLLLEKDKENSSTSKIIHLLEYLACKFLPKQVWGYFRIIHISIKNLKTNNMLQNFHYPPPETR